jgi:hypothetical protein
MIINNPINMTDHFRLRSRKYLSTTADTETRMQISVIHGVAFFSVLLAAFSVGFSVWNSSKLPTNVQGAAVEQNEKQPSRNYDKFRGYKKVKGEALGYFSFQMTDADKWSLVTPEGNAFFGMAANKIWPFNIDDQAFKEKFNNSNNEWAISATTLIDSMRFNMFGNSAYLIALMNPNVLRFPFTLTGDFVEWEHSQQIAKDDFPDVWDAPFATEVDEKTRRMSEAYGDDPYLVLEFPANELHLNLQRVDGTADPASVYWKKLVEVEGKTPAKDVWVNIYKTRYDDDIEAVNAVYGTTMVSFDEMYDLRLGLYNRFTTVEEDEEEDAQKAYQDIDDWSTEIGKQFHKVIYESAKQYMPNLIVTSERLVQANHSPLYFEKIKPYIDALAFNMYLTTEQVAPSEETLDRYTAMVDNKPLIVSEHSFLQEPCNLSGDGGTYPGVVTQADRATAHMAYRNSVLEHPAVTMLAWHEYSDVWTDVNTCGYTNFGFVSLLADPYQEMIDAGRAIWQDFNELRWKTEAQLDTAKGFQQPDVTTNTNTAKSNEPTKKTDTASNFKKDTTLGFNPKRDSDQLLKPIVGVTKGSNFKTNTDTGAHPKIDTDVSRNLPDSTDGVADLIPNGSTLSGFFALPKDIFDRTNAMVPKLPVLDPDHTLDVPVTIQVDLPEGSRWNDDQLRALAASHRGVSNRFVGFTAEQIATMKAANPYLLVSQYLNLASGGFVLTRAELAEVPGIVIKKKDGTPETRLLSPSDRASILDPADETWRQLFIDAAVEAVTTGGADGILADQAVIVNQLCTCFEGINPATGNIYTDEEWRNAMYDFLKEVKAAIGDKLLIVNSIANGPEFYREGGERFNDVVDGYVAEGWGGKPWWTTDQYSTVDQWRENIRLLTDLESKGESVSAVAKFQLDSVTSEESLLQKELFTFTSFMLGKGDKTTFSSKEFDPENPIDADIPYPDYWQVDIGSPLAPYIEEGNVAKRDFENGKIVVNPGKDPQIVDLGGSYKTLEGTILTSLTMEPHTGVILLNP